MTLASRYDIWQYGLEFPGHFQGVWINSHHWLISWKCHICIGNSFQYNEIGYNKFGFLERIPMFKRWSPLSRRFTEWINDSVNRTVTFARIHYFQHATCMIKCWIKPLRVAFIYLFVFVLFFFILHVNNKKKRLNQWEEKWRFRILAFHNE